MLAESMHQSTLNDTREFRVFGDVTANHSVTRTDISPRGTIN